MPLYEYNCKKCDNSFTDVQTVDNRHEPTKNPCEYCGGELFIALNANPWLDAWDIGLKKPPSHVRERLESIHKNTPGSKMKI